MSNFQSYEPDEYLQKFWDEYGPALWDYLVDEYPAYPSEQDGLRDIMRIEEDVDGDMVYIIYAIEWYDEDGINMYSFCFDTGYIVYDAANNEITRAEHTNHSSLRQDAFKTLRVTQEDCDYFMERERDSFYIV